TVRGVEPGGCARPVGAAVLARAACERGDDPGRDDDLPDSVVVGVGDIEVARPVAGHAVRVGEAGGRARAIHVAGPPQATRQEAETGRRGATRLAAPTAGAGRSSGACRSGGTAGRSAGT